MWTNFILNKRLKQQRVQHKRREQYDSNTENTRVRLVSIAEGQINSFRNSAQLPYGQRYIVLQIIVSICRLTLIAELPLIFKDA